jgi:ribosome recycling factor
MSANSIPDITKDCRTAMDKALESAKRELSSIRSGKATTSLLDTVRVEAYGQQVPIAQVASVAAPEARLLVVTPWDKGLTKAIETGIRESHLGLDPATQGGIIRVPLPSLNEERRKELVKVAHKYAEAAKVAVRHVRRDGLDTVKKLEKNHEISEDDQERLAADVQKATDGTISEIDHLLAAKEKEILTV